MGIYSKIIDIQKLGLAWEKVKRNKPACGTDHVTYEMFEEKKREELRQLNLELLEHRYKSLPVKLTQICKGEKLRMIALFSMRDKVVQQSLAHELSRLYEPLFSTCTRAYRPGQSVLETLNKIEEKVKEEKSLYVLKMDIEDFFDSIPHDLLIKTLSAKIMEQDVLDLLQIILKTEALDEVTGQRMEKRRGIYQGLSCAPVLSNIYLMDYDREMEQQCGFYMRYSDDILILDQSEEKIRIILEYSRHFFEEKGLKIKEEKLQMHGLTVQAGFSYLGYQFTSEGKSVPEKAVASLTARLERMWLTSRMTLDQKIKKGQEILGGWEQYYKGDRKAADIIEFTVLLSMVRRKPEEVKKKIEEQRFQIDNCYRDITEYLVKYWIEEGKPVYALLEYEQFYRIPDEKMKTEAVPNKWIEELLKCYSRLFIQQSEDVYTEIMQLYTDQRMYKKAACFWKMKTQESQKYFENTKLFFIY